MIMVDPDMEMVEVSGGKKHPETEFGLVRRCSTELTCKIILPVPDAKFQIKKAALFWIILFFSVSGHPEI